MMQDELTPGPGKATSSAICPGLGRVCVSRVGQSVDGFASCRRASRTGVAAVEMMRHLKVARRTAVKARTSAMITLKQIVVTAPPELRAEDPLA